MIVSSKSEYISTIVNSGFKNITIQKQKAIVIPDDILTSYFTESEISAYKKTQIGIFSMTVYGEKEIEKKNCCGPECCS